MTQPNTISTPISWAVFGRDPEGKPVRIGTVSKQDNRTFNAYDRRGEHAGQSTSRQGAVQMIRRRWEKP